MVRSEPPSQRLVGIWLLAVAALVFAMVLVGGATRLTDSGLSMVEWRPATGWLPPMTEAAWQAEFDRYQASPEFRHHNPWMALADFKGIFWLEFLHRLFGRVIGVLFFVPLLWFWWQGAITGANRFWMVGLFVMGGLQGAIGWWMVKSGLVDQPEVSQYRLAVHLGLAILIFAGLFWMALAYLKAPKPGGCAGNPPPETSQIRGTYWALGLVYLQILLGALVAGLDAGMAYNSFPLMDGMWLPPEALSLQPWWLNLSENPAMVQFLHRLGGVVVAATVLWVGINARYHPATRRVGEIAIILVAAQFALGVATLLLFVPLTVALLHQAGALSLLSVLLVLLFQQRHRGPTTRH